MSNTKVLEVEKKFQKTRFWTIPQRTSELMVLLISGKPCIFYRLFDIFAITIVFFTIKQASIIGYNTKKVLYMGVRNKYCSICDKAKLNGNTASAHVCFKNWDGASTAMEADIIVEGFRQSIPMHNIIYNKLIGDGDSSVTKKLFLAKPYGHDVFVKKIECMNHILRNYLNRIVDLSVHRKSSSGTVVPGFLRKVLKDKRLKLRYVYMHNLYEN